MNATALVGLVTMIVSEAATLAGVEPFRSWNTPIAWTGFILFADAIVYRARGSSWLKSSPREFAFLAIVSIPLWLVFEFFNLYLNNWYYTGLPNNFALRLFGYAWSFATIWPAIFEAADLMSVWLGGPAGIGRDGARRPIGSGVSSPSGRRRIPTLPALSIVSGAVMLMSPFLVPAWIAQYLAAPVWLGFIFLLEPINWKLGGESLARDFSDGDYLRLKNLVLSGFLCGGLWEFWNYWAGAKWHYTVPIMEHLKIFEMPVPGYLGFPAFAIECFTMYVFVRAVSTSLGLDRTLLTPRPIAH
jgi:hypothetical protein